MRRARLPVALPQVLSISAALQDRADLAYWLPPTAPAAAAADRASSSRVGDGSGNDDGAANGRVPNGGAAAGVAGGSHEQRLEGNGDASVEAGAGGEEGAAHGDNRDESPWLPLALEVRPNIRTAQHCCSDAGGRAASEGASFSVMELQMTIEVSGSLLADLWLSASASTLALAHAGCSVSWAAPTVRAPTRARPPS